jgi:DNA-binding transcriptional MerR regulator
VLRLGEVAERSRVPVELLRALEASGLLRPHHMAEGDRYSDADVRFVRHVLTLLGVGLSLDDLMRIARQQLVTSDALGRDVVTAWAQLVGTRLRSKRHEAPDQAARVAASLRALAAIVGQLVAYRVERSVLDAAQEEIEAEGSPAEREALARSLTSPPGRARQSEELPEH